MKTKPTSSKILNSRLAAYSATATVALLAAPTAADAQIQNITGFTVNGSATSTPPSLNQMGGSVNNLNFTAGIFKLHFQNVNVRSTTSKSHSHNRELDITPGSTGSSNKILDSNGGNLVAKRFAFGDALVGSTQFWGKLAQNHTNHPTNGAGATLVAGNFYPGGANATKTGYVGIRDRTHGTTYLGWLRVKVTNDGNGSPVEISLLASEADSTIFGAFEKVSDGLLTAGEIAPATEPSVAALGGLALLACGAAGVRELRRRRQTEIKTN